MAKAYPIFKIPQGDELNVALAGEKFRLPRADHEMVFCGKPYQYSYYVSENNGKTLTIRFQTSFTGSFAPVEIHIRTEDFLGNIKPKSQWADLSWSSGGVDDIPPQVLAGVYSEIWKMTQVIINQFESGLVF